MSQVPHTGFPDIETNVAGMREALRRLAIFCEWDIQPPTQHWCPDAEQYDVSRLIRGLLDDDLVRRRVEERGLGSRLVERLIGSGSPE